MRAASRQAGEVALLVPDSQVKVKFRRFKEGLEWLTYSVVSRRAGEVAFWSQTVKVKFRRCKF